MDGPSHRFLRFLTSSFGASHRSPSCCHRPLVGLRPTVFPSDPFPVFLVRSSIEISPDRIDTWFVLDRCGSTRAQRADSCDIKPTEQPHVATWQKWRPRCAHSDAAWKTRSKRGVGRRRRTSVHVAAASVAWEWSTSAANADDRMLRKRSKTMGNGWNGWRGETKLVRMRGTTCKKAWNDGAGD